MLLTLRILHLNDSHSALDRAGRVKTIIDTARRIDPDVLVLHAGDALVGTPWYEVGVRRPAPSVRGEAEVEGRGALDFQVLEALGIDAFVIGNHDMDDGIKNFARALGSRRIPLTVANWRITGPLRRRVKPYRVRLVRGQQVVIIGLSIDPHAYGLPEGEGIRFADPAAALEELLPVFRKKSRPAAILVLSHLGMATDERLAGYFPEVAAIIGGHSHTVTPFPERRYHPDHAMSVVVQVGANHEYVGLLELDIAGGKVVAVQGGLVQVAEAIPPDPGIEALLEPYRPALTPYREVIGRAREAIPLVTRGSPDSPLGHLVADWVREAAVRQIKKKVHLAILNQTGLRQGLPRGPITRWDLFQVYPFANTLMVTTLSGEQVQVLLDHAATRGGDPVSGVTFTLDGDRAVDVRIGGRKLEREKAYRVASNSYLIGSGGSGYAVLTQGRDPVDTGLGIRAVLEETVKACGEVRRPDDPVRIRRPDRPLSDEIRRKWGLVELPAEEMVQPFGRP